MNVNAIKFRKKPVVIEAYQWKESDALNLRGKGWPNWLVAATRCAEDGAGQIVTQSFEGYATIKTLEGEMRADIGDWIIRGINGELYPCKPDIFAATYEPADVSAPADVLVSDIPPHQLRVLEELAQLTDRLDKLTAFFDTSIYRSLPVDERGRLKEQCALMGELQRVLAERAAAF